MEQYLKENGITTLEELKKAIEEMEKINLALFKGEPI